MGCLDEVENCLERAERSSKACLEGITKADLVLKETKGDSDIQCVALVKRTELLFIAVSHFLVLFPCVLVTGVSGNAFPCVGGSLSLQASLLAVEFTLALHLLV